MWRDLLGRLGARHGRDRSGIDAPAGIDPWEAVVRVQPPGSELLDGIERTALEIYARHGLPTAPGHYRQGSGARSWSFLGEHLTPEARWTLMMERPPEKGWRYGTLADIGRSGPPEVRAASALLAECVRLRNGAGAAGGQDLLDIVDAAIRLGADWRVLESGRLKAGGTRLRLTAPDDVIAMEATATIVPPKPGPARASRRKAPRQG
ncbi:hypothetical protein [Brevundimonas subvibrioides]|uniref:hypothetical protein n=1 Tax=Brevundimonas subvibrioides TaxID=74313 RepID=UPI0022B41269|nr:hypothetical protein [Brevundimonas subvibrioides]